MQEINLFIKEMTSIQNQLDLLSEIDKDEYFYGLKKKIYAASKSGFALNLATLLNKITNPDIRNILVNQVIIIIIKLLIILISFGWKNFRTQTRKKKRFSLNHHWQ